MTNTIKFLSLLIIIIALSGIIIYQNEFSIKKTAVDILTEIGIRDKFIPVEKIDIPFVYRAYLSNVSEITPIEFENINNLPNFLVIKPGSYNFVGQTYNLEQEGLYRFINPGVMDEQRIVYAENLDVLLSSIAWIYSHGTADNSLSYEMINSKTLNYKIFATCSKISKWVEVLLQKEGYKTRVISTITLDVWTNLGNRHTMIEVFHPYHQKWILYDLDNNTYFEKNNIPLSAVEFANLVPTNDYSIKYLANDSKIDISNYSNHIEGYDVAFWAESVYANEETLRHWYQKVIQVVSIHEENKLFFFDERDIVRIQSYSQKYKHINQEEFMNRFYS